ncbi:hypothetical protein BJ912DRAFT_1125959 [Pholiota molesta]|nr:hypothetical protein BJ912DRAFT_1125959 [Pholiota molesta]
MALAHAQRGQRRLGCLPLPFSHVFSRQPYSRRPKLPLYLRWSLRMDGAKKPSIRLDMLPSYTTGYELSHAGIVQVILVNMDRTCLYINRFNNNGNGCRHWCATALDKLMEGGYIDGPVQDAFTKYEEDCAATYGDRILTPRIRGTFYH